jgi:hypothetical protein
MPNKPAAVIRCALRKARMASGAYRRGDVAIRHPARVIVGLLAALIFCAFLVQVPGCVLALSPKIGRVINHDSGEGIPGAAVVAMGQRGTTQPRWCCGGMPVCTYAVIAYTDKDGYYQLPSAWTRASVGEPGDVEHWWKLYVSKKGYVTEGTKLPMPVNSMGWVLDGTFNYWDSRSGFFSWNGLGVKILPLELKQAELALKERVAYFLSTGLTTTWNCITDEPYRSQMQSAVRAFYEDQQAYVCHASPDETADAKTVERLYGISGNFHAFENRLKQLDPRFVVRKANSQRISIW